ncbi:hypothetical protein K435DRAFT_239258 [Dendrothele bispora CBS 962.96]|uniref:DASH complex subunit DAD1 n=1 Tax=Dendrothele bispora (strain CBS 962.96) TaxID=1314807 RepID=A0A4V4HHS9_DENBC|nr:hypothetical protein K435DRAFT_239258 [Dendrothele bispora CBS 962.96]
MLSQSQTEEDRPFFERERERLTREITSGFEELLSTTNGLNRKLEEVLGMTREYDTIAALWQTFYELMRQPGSEGDTTIEEQLPATGGHAVK